MNIPTELVCVLLSAVVTLQGFILISLKSVSERLTRIETALELHGLLDHHNP